MGKWDSVKDKRVKEVIDARDLINDALDLDKRLAHLRGSLKKFDEEITLEKEKEQTKDFK